MLMCFHLAYEQLDRTLLRTRNLAESRPNRPLRQSGTVVCARHGAGKSQRWRTIQIVAVVNRLLKPMLRAQLQITHDYDIGCRTILRPLEEFVLAARAKIPFYVLERFFVVDVGNGQRWFTNAPGARGLTD